MRISISLVAFAAPLLIATASHAAVINLVQNGDFSAALSGPWAVAGPVGIAAITGSPGNEVLNIYGNVPSFPPGSGATVSQATAAMFANTTYAVEFDFSRSSFSNDSVFTAMLGASTLFTSVSPPQNPPSGSFSFLYQNISAGATPTLSFISSAGGTNFVIDNVVVRQVPGPLPLLGVAAAFAWTRKLRRRIKDSEGQAALA